MKSLLSLSKSSSVPSPSKSLVTSFQLVSSLHCAEHVSIAIYNQPNRYKLFNIVAPASLRRPDLIIELDEQSDYQFIKTIFENIYPIKQNFELNDIINFLDDNPKIKKINSNVIRKWE